MTDKSRFTQVFRELYPEVLAFARRRVDPDSAEEVAAETFTIAWRKWDSAPTKLRPWLFGIAKNVMRDQSRSATRRGRLSEYLQMHPVPPRGDIASDGAHRLDLQAAWGRLSPGDREVIALVAWDGLSSREAACVLNTSSGTFTVRLSRARRRLKRHLEISDE